MQQGRRTASLKASYEAVSKSVELTKELALGREYSSAASRSAQATSAADGVSVTKASLSRNKKCVLSVLAVFLVYTSYTSLGARCMLYCSCYFASLCNTEQVGYWPVYCRFYAL